MAPEKAELRPVRDAKPNSIEPVKSQPSVLFEVLSLVALLVLLAGEPVPGVNESHYLPKAKHALDPSFCARDLFICSNDSHWLSAALAGGLASLFPLYTVAWIGRLLCWTLMALAWRRLRLSLEIPVWLGLLLLAAWYFAVDIGNWAGEWAIGGFEGKAIAYVCVIVAISEAIEGRWNRVWLWLGGAVAWHPLAGGWAGLSIGIYWLFSPKLLDRLRVQWPWLLAATAIGMVGVLPAGLGLQSPNREGNLVASTVHVYFRLYHHLSPRLFAWERHVAGTITLGLLVASSVLAFHTRYWNASARKTACQWLVSIAWISVGFAAVGLTIDSLFSLGRPEFASRLLRFYWFRWFDIAVPLAWSLTIGCFLWEAQAHGRAITANASAGGLSARWNMSVLALTIFVVLILGITARHLDSLFRRDHPVADDIVLEAPANREIESDRYVDWLAACQWIAQNTPKDSLWFTPEYQQTFKWYAQRSEVVCWKDVPQDNHSVIEWYKRVKECRPARTLDGGREEWTSQGLLALARRYGFRWVLVDRRQQVRPLDFEFMYPIQTVNKSFAIFRISEFYFRDQESSR